MAARTYIQRHRGQYRNEGYDICATDACQVYLGAGTEDALASQAVLETRGVIATYDDKPINALYSSTCGGRTENAENIFDEKVPYLVSTSCDYKHPEALPFSSSRSFPDWTSGGSCGRRRCQFLRRAAFHGPAESRRAAVEGAHRPGLVHSASVLPVGRDDVRCVVRHRAGDPASCRVPPHGGASLSAHRQEGRVRMAAGSPGLLGRPAA